MKCVSSYWPQYNYQTLIKITDLNEFRFSFPIVIHSIIIYKHFNNNNAYMILMPNNKPDKEKRIDMSNIASTGINTQYFIFPLICIVVVIIHLLTQNSSTPPY